MSAGVLTVALLALIAGVDGHGAMTFPRRKTTPVNPLMHTPHFPTRPSTIDYGGSLYDPLPHVSGHPTPLSHQRPSRLTHREPTFENHSAEFRRRRL